MNQEAPAVHTTDHEGIRRSPTPPGCRAEGARRNARPSQREPLERWRPRRARTEEKLQENDEPTAPTENTATARNGEQEIQQTSKPKDGTFTITPRASDD